MSRPEALPSAALGSPSILPLPLLLKALVGPGRRGAGGARLRQQLSLTREGVWVKLCQLWPLLSLVASVQLCVQSVVGSPAGGFCAGPAALSRPGGR